MIPPEAAVMVTTRHLRVTIVHTEVRRFDLIIYYGENYVSVFLWVMIAFVEDFSEKEVLELIMRIVERHHGNPDLFMKES